MTCDAAPDLCPEFWLDNNMDEVVADPEQPSLRRRLPFDASTRMIMATIFGNRPIVGDGASFGEMLADGGDPVAES